MSFLLARDTLHQNQWAAAVRELPNTVEKAAGTLQDKLNKE